MEYVQVTSTLQGYLALVTSTYCPLSTSTSGGLRDGRLSGTLAIFKKGKVVPDKIIKSSVAGEHQQCGTLVFSGPNSSERAIDESMIRRTAPGVRRMSMGIIHPSQ